MRSNPFFSIIIPAYNRAKFIDKAITSVINQSFEDWELIIVDDGSTDNTKQVVEEFVDERIKYIYKSNNERSAARNTGIENSRGKYICFLDSDEYFIKNHLDEFYKIIFEKSFPEALIYCNTYEEKQGKLICMEQNEIKARNNIEFVIQNMISSNRVCIHKNILNKHQYHEKIRIGEDTELWTRILREYPLIANNKYTVVIINHENRTVHISNELSFIGHLNLIKKIINDDQENYISTKVRKEVLSYAYFNLAKHYIFKNIKVKAILNLTKSVFYHFKHKQTKHKLYLIFNLLFNSKSIHYQ